MHAFFLWHERGRIRKGDPDFTVFYTAGRMLRQGQARALYDLRAQYGVQREFAANWDIRKGPLPYIHPPFEALLFLPLTSLTYASAFLSWELVNLALLIGIALLLRKSQAFLNRIPVWEIVLAFFAFFPVFTNFLQGQDAILLLFLCTLGFVLLQRESEIAAGIIFGLGLFKYQFTIPLLLILALWKRSRVVAAFVGTGAFLAIVSLAMVGWKGMAEYPSLVLQVAQEAGRGQVPYGLMPNLLGLELGWKLADRFGLPLRLIVLAVSAGLIAIAGRVGDSRTSPRTFSLSFALAVVTCVLVSYQASSHDLCLLLLPLALVADWVSSYSRRFSWPQVRLLVPVLPLLFSPLWIFLWLVWHKTNLLVILLLWWGWEIHRVLRDLRLQEVAISAGLQDPEP